MLSNSNFSDIQNHWAKDAIRQLLTRSIVSGYPDGTFRPNNPVTRAEFAAILRKAFANAAPIRASITFRDVPANHWASSAIQAVTRAGFFSGYPDSTFRPNLPIPRVQAVVALVSGLKYNPDPNPNSTLEQYFDDTGAIPKYALGAIATATQKRLMVNYPDIRRFHPNQNATRGEIAALICRALNLPGVPFQYIPGLDLIVIAPQFQQADSFSQGRARVKIKDKWGYIDNTGKLIVEPFLEQAETFSEGLALIRTNSENRQNSPPSPPPSGEIRGVWLTTTDSRLFSSQETIAQAMDFLAQTGFNVVFPVVWNNAATLYPSRLMRENFGLEIDPRYAKRDPLQELITQAKRVGLAVIPWFEYGFASSFSQNGGHLITKKPDWAARDPSGNLLTKNNFEWLNAFDPEVQDFLLSLIREVIQNYDIAGIQGDDRLPALPSEGGYDRKTVQRYLQQFNQNPPSNPKETKWIQWRADLLTNFLTRLYQEVVSINPQLIISMSPSPYPWGLVEYLQDTQAWVDRGLVDMIHPQLYRRDFEGYKQLIDRVVNEQFTSVQLPSVFPGILIKVSSYRINAEHLLKAIQYNRDRGISGEVLFFYEGLREDNEALAKALRSGPYAQSVPFNSGAVKARSFTERRVGGKYNYIDLFGKSITQPQFDWAASFKEERAPVKMGYKWGYIDKTGQLVSRWEFDQADAFAEGLALVKIGSKYGYINQGGQRVIPPQFDQAKSFNQGLAAVQVGSQWGYIDKLGQFVITPQFEQAESFTQGLAVVKIADKYGYINQSGQQVIGISFDQAGAVSEGLAPVKNGNTWGYIDLTGQLIIALQFEDAKSFQSGLAAVKIAGKWGYIDKLGQVIIPPDFEEVESFCEGLALVKLDGKWGYIRNLSL